MEKTENTCSNCQHFYKDEIGDGLCSNPYKPHHHDYVAADEYCFAHEINIDNKELEKE